MKLTLWLAFTAMVLRVGLYYAGVHIGPFHFAPVHLLMLVLSAFFCGHILLGLDPSLGFGDLLRAGFTSIMVYSLLIALFTWFFYSEIDSHAFTAYNERLVQGFVARGRPVALARLKVDALYNAGNYAMLTFFGLLFTGVINVLVFALLHDKVLRKLRR